MTGLLRNLKKLDPTLKEVIVSPFIQDKEILGYNGLVINAEGALGGGVAVNPEESIRIALAEFIERSLVKTLFFSPPSSSLKTRFFLDRFPTTCGFAAGFTDDKTFLRALCEAIERWAWSQWIDQNFFIPSYPLEQERESLDPLSRFFLGNFEKVLAFKADFSFHHPLLGKARAHLGIVLGLRGEGVFPGSRVSLSEVDLWKHPLVEAYRHWDIFQKASPEISPDEDRPRDMVTRRILHFAENREEALAAVSRAWKTTWPSLKFSMTESLDLSGEDYYLWRVLAEGYKGWHEGCQDRFVY